MCRCLTVRYTRVWIFARLFPVGGKEKRSPPYRCLRGNKGKVRFAAAAYILRGRKHLESWIDRFGFEGEHREHRLVDPPQRIARGETVQRLQAQRVLTQRQRPFPA